MSEAKKILVVDDDCSVRDALEEFVSYCYPDAIVQTAKDGAETLRLLQEQDYSLLIMDTQMPGLSGYEICSEIRASRKTLIIIGMSCDRNYRQSWVNAGANEFISKNDMHTIDNLLEKYLGKGRELLPIK